LTSVFSLPAAGNAKTRADFCALSVVNSSLIGDAISSLTKTKPTSESSVNFVISVKALSEVSEIIPGIPANWKLVTKDLLPTVEYFHS
jgi:hypothetical protein